MTALLAILQTDLHLDRYARLFRDIGCPGLLANDNLMAVVAPRVYNPRWIPH